MCQRLKTARRLVSGDSGEVSRMFERKNIKIANRREQLCSRVNKATSFTYRESIPGEKKRARV